MTGARLVLCARLHISNHARRYLRSLMAISPQIETPFDQPP